MSGVPGRDGVGRLLDDVVNPGFDWHLRHLSSFRRVRRPLLLRAHACAPDLGLRFFFALRALPPTCAQAWPLPCCVSNSSCVPRRASLLWPWLSPVTCRRQGHLNTNELCCPISERFATLPTQKTPAFAREP